MKITVLDAYTIIQQDLSLDGLKAFGDLTIYPRTPAELTTERIGNSEIVFTCKTKITSKILEQCPFIKFIGVQSTGYDVVDIEAAKKKGIAVCNVPAYSTESVAQHTMALILETANHVGEYTRDIHNGRWAESPDYCFTDYPVMQLFGRSLGIIGYGNIGKRVGEIAEAFGMKINIYSRNPEETIKSDFVTLHCPSTKENTGFINKDFIDKMKDGAVLINASRGALINEKDLVYALESKKLAAAAVDVASVEPAPKDHPFIGVKNLYITPHVAWSTFESRQTVCTTCVENLKSFLNGGKLNRIV